jgi:hypothetical protein
MRNLHCFKSSIYKVEPGVAVSIVSGYGLDDRAIKVRSPADEKIVSFSLEVQTGTGATQPPIQWVLGVLSPGLKSGRGVTQTTHPLLVPKSRTSRSYTSSAPKHLRGV